MYVIIHSNLGAPDKVVVFDDQHDPLPYIKEHLRKWDNDAVFQNIVNDLDNMEDAVMLLETEAIYALQVYEVNELNPSIGGNLR